MRQILPLKLDLGRVSDRTDIFFDFFYDPSGGRRKEINRQLSLRPEVWGIGLWPDEESELIARKIGELLCKAGKLKKNAFIPDDPLADINALKYECGLFADVSDHLDEVFECWILPVEWEDLINKTFGDLVQIVKERKGTALHLESEHFSVMGWFKTFGLNWLIGILSWFFIMLLLAATYLLAFGVMRFCGLDDERVFVTFSIWAVIVMAFSIWKGRKGGVLTILYYLSLIGFCAGALWHFMAGAPLGKVISVFR